MFKSIALSTILFLSPTSSAACDFQTRTFQSNGIDRGDIMSSQGPPAKWDAVTGEWNTDVEYLVDPLFTVPLGAGALKWSGTSEVQSETFPVGNPSTASIRYKMGLAINFALAGTPAHPSVESSILYGFDWYDTNNAFISRSSDNPLTTLGGNLFETFGKIFDPPASAKHARVFVSGPAYLNHVQVTVLPPYSDRTPAAATTALTSGSPATWAAITFDAGVFHAFGGAEQVFENGPYQVNAFLALTDFANGDIYQARIKHYPRLLTGTPVYYYGPVFAPGAASPGGLTTPIGFGVSHSVTCAAGDHLYIEATQLAGSANTVTDDSQLTINKSDDF